MIALLDKVNTVPGMVGSMICDENGHLLAHHFPPSFETGMLEKAVAMVAENAPELHSFTGREGMLDFRYQSGRIIVKPISSGYIILLCTRSANLQLLNLSVNVAAAKLERIIKAASAASAPPAGHPAAPGLTAEELMEQGQLSPSLKGIQTALAKFVGPMAKIILLECIEIWSTANPPSRAALPELVDLVAREVERYGKGAAFVEMAAPYV